MTDRGKIIETLQKALDNAEIDGMIYAEVRRPVVFDIISLLKEQEAEIKRLKSELHGLGDLFHTLSEKAEKAIAEQPDIVRCKDCRHYTPGVFSNKGTNFGECHKLAIGLGVCSSEDWFCADGERK